MNPAEHTTQESRTLGLNRNRGEVIELRLRTDAYDGYRDYKVIRKTLCHELAHNVHGEHDNNVRSFSSRNETADFNILSFQFKELNSRLNREVAAFERAARDGAHSLSSVSDAYEPGLEVEAQDALITGTFTLGGGPLGSAPASSGNTKEERRQRMLEATIERLRKQEEEVEHSCGTSGPAASGSPRRS